MLNYYQFIFLGGLVEGNIEKLCRQWDNNLFCQTVRPTADHLAFPAIAQQISEAPPIHCDIPRHAPVKFPNTLGCHIMLAGNHRSICWCSSARARLISNCLLNSYWTILYLIFPFLVPFTCNLQKLLSTLLPTNFSNIFFISTVSTYSKP